jgi:hypothetical protein
MAIFAYQLGFDKNSSWGAGRIVILATGILIVICTAFFSLVTSRLKRIYFLAGLIVILVMSVYVWSISVGYWTTWPKTTNYYDMLATSFQHGQLSLQIKPDSILLAMPDPYDIYAREAQPNLTYLFDGSFYKGKYYLYWGPVPALLLLPFKFISPGEIGDQFLVFAFVAGLFIFQSLLILRVWERFFQNIPAWTVLIGILLAGFITPRTWILNQPQIYEASIEGGQFFLIGAVYFAFTALETRTPSIGRLVWTGIFLSLAVGSRNVLVLPVIFITLMIALWIVRSYRRETARARMILIFTGLTLPLAIGAGLLGWYNWARFGSVLESGLRFQLSGINYRQYYNDLFSIKYVILNLRYYLFIPYRFVHGFPFIKPISTSSWPPLSLPVPVFYYAKERVSSLVYSCPFLVFAFIVLAIPVSRMHRERQDKDASDSDNDAGKRLLPWLSIGLLGIAAVSFITLMLYYYCTMRFVDDFIPALTLLALLGFWQGYRLLSQKRVSRLIYEFISLGLGAFTIAAGLLLGVSSYAERFRYLNPELFIYIIKIFSR